MNNKKNECGQLIVEMNDFHGTWCSVCVPDQGQYKRSSSQTVADVNKNDSGTTSRPNEDTVAATASKTYHYVLQSTLFIIR